MSFTSLTPIFPGRRNAFTLVEMLLVITIISILVAMLLPAIGTAKATARRVACLSNERQIAIGFAGYLNDYRMMYPYANPAWPNQWPLSWSVSSPARPWMMAISPYINSYKAGDAVSFLRCPENPWPAYAPNYQNQPAPTYGMGPAFPSNWADQSGVNALTDATHFRQPLKEASLKQPSGTLLLGELVNGSNLPFSTSSWSGGVTVIHTLFQSPYTGSSFWLTQDIGVLSSASNTVRVNHNLAWNSAMADGSARLDTKKQLQTWAQVLYTGGTEQTANRYWLNAR